MGKALLDVLRSRFESTDTRIAACRKQDIETAFQDIEGRLRAGELSGRIYDRYIKSMRSEGNPPPEWAQSLLLVARPIGRTILELDLAGGHVLATIPPTYGAEELIAEEEEILGPILEDAGFRFARAWLPLKSIAVRAGLASYGRDNVLHFPGAGSFVRLDAWWASFDAEGEYWGEPRVMERCAGCGICARACPNGCFETGRFLIDATRCLTFLNEGADPFPAWLGAEYHNAAVGCLRCQDACPDNRGVEGRKVYRRFSLDRATSELVLGGRPAGELPEEAAKAVRAAEMVGIEDRLARNLKALIEARASPGRSGA